MVTKWLQAGRRPHRSSLHREQPPIQVTPSTLDRIPPQAFASISLFQSVDHTATINHFGSSQSGNTIHIAVLAPSLTSNGAAACRQITQDCWQQQMRSKPGWADSKEALSAWLEAVQESLFKFGGGSLTTGLQGLTIDHDSKKAYLFLSGLGGVTLVSKDNEVKHVYASDDTRLLGTPHSKAPTPQTISTKSLSAMVVASDDFSVSALERAIHKIRVLPYPKMGAAELLYFELQKTRSGSSILWIEF